ncbi:MAG: XylR family transcriptional regulator [Kiritimatiellae bacterium]|nr:XylR family transcriptional regulator [Kiritimatiellia bacterium]
MAKFLTKTPRVLIELPTGLKSCRDKLQGILHYVQLNGPWDLHVMMEGHPYIARLESLENWQPDGRIIGCLDDKIIGGAVNLNNIPVVTLDIPCKLYKRAICINHNSEDIAASIADYYIKQKFENFAYVGSETNTDWSIIRAEAFEKAVRKCGFSCNGFKLDSLKTSTDWDFDKKKMQDWLLGLPKPCGIMVAFDHRARQVLECCQQCGIDVPDDIAVIGVDNDEAICENTTPTLSSVLPDFEGGGYLAAEVLDHLMRSMRRKPCSLTYGIKRIVHRQSSQHTSNPNWIASRIKEFIRLNACEGITVNDTARHLNVSRRLAEQRFREACGHTILTEIQTQRLDRVCALLKETNLPIGTIGERCGYQTETYLKALFKKTFGMTMRTYRKKN